MDDLPELPFEKVLSYLSLEDRLKARAVSRRWYNLIDSFKVKTLCYSEYSSGFILGKSRLISGAFAQNFINSPRFGLFFNTFGSTILSNLKHLRICDLGLNAQDNSASTLIPTLNLFGRLEELDLIRFTYSDADSSVGKEFELNLPILTSIRLDEVRGIDQLTLDAPKLKRIKLLECSPSLRLKIVHADSVEWLGTSSLAPVEVKNLKSLKYLHGGLSEEIDSTFLSSLEKLKEVHLLKSFMELFEQKQRYGRADLKIFLFGSFLNDLDDPAIRSFNWFNSMVTDFAKNPSRVADEMPIWRYLPYMLTGGVDLESEINILSKFTDLNTLIIESSIAAQDVQRFLDLLKNVPNIVNLCFKVDQSQDLFDRLPEYSAVQYLFVNCPVSDLRFLFRLEHLILFQYFDQINAEVIREAFEKLQFLSLFHFKYLNKMVSIRKASSNLWLVSKDGFWTNVVDLNAVIQLIFGETQKRDAEELE